LEYNYIVVVITRNQTYYIIY